MVNIEFILRNDVAIKRLDYHNGKAIAIFKIHNRTEYYGYNNTQPILIGQYDHKKHLLQLNTALVNSVGDVSMKDAVVKFLSM